NLCRAGAATCRNAGKRVQQVAICSRNSIGSIVAGDQSPPWQLLGRSGSGSVRWASVIVNSLMLAATPIDGSHNLVDVLAGVAIAAACILAAHKLVSRTVAMPVTAHNLAPAEVRVASTR